MKRSIFVFAIAAVIITCIIAVCCVSALGGVISGDIDKNGKADTTDCILMKRFLLNLAAPTESELESADINGDGRIDTTDYAWLKRMLIFDGTLEYKQDGEKEFSLEIKYDKDTADTPEILNRDSIRSKYAAGEEITLKVAVEQDACCVVECFIELNGKTLFGSYTDDPDGDPDVRYVVFNFKMPDRDTVAEIFIAYGLRVEES